MSIVIVDDNPINLYSIEKVLTSEGYKDNVALNSAYELFDYLKLDSAESRNTSVDLILLDLMMPEIDGIEACRRIQQSEHLRDIPIIFVTALEDSKKFAEAMDAGATDYVTKPINKTELMARIRSALRLKYEKDWHYDQEKRFRNELDLAKQVQKSVLSNPLNDENIQIQAYYNPSFELAGDLYYWYKLDDTRYAAILLDMMGHGISSSLVCMFIASVLRDTIKAFEDPCQVIRELNRYMLQLHNKEYSLNYYFTAVYLIIDTKQKTIEYVNAGHPYGMALLDGNTLVQLDTGSCAVGLFEPIEVHKSVIHYQQNAKILLYTDGVLEALDKDITKSLQILTNEVSDGWPSLTALLDTLLPEEIREQQPDDMCMVMIEAK